MRLPALAFVLTTVCSANAYPQSSPYQATVPAVAAVQLAPVSPIVPAPLATPADLLAARRFNSRAPGATLMIIGGAATVAGILVGGSGGFVLILGGIAVGAYGFYLYSR